MIEWLALQAQAFEFLRPGFLLCLPLVFGLQYLLTRLQSRSEWEAFIDPVLLEPLLQKPESQGWLTPQRLAQGTVFVWVLALSGPSWKDKPTPFADDKAPLVIAISLSSSMLADDLLPSRLARAKIKISQLLETRRGSPTALIAFAETAHVVLPLTEDSDILKLYLDELSPDIMPRPGLNIEAALGASAELLASAGMAGSVLLVSDKVNHTAANPLAAGVSVSLLWVGMNAATREERVLGAAVAASADPVDRAAALAFSQTQAVELIDMSADHSDLKRLQRRITHQFESAANAQHRQREDGGYYFIFPLLLLLLLWFRKGMVLQ